MRVIRSQAGEVSMVVVALVMATLLAAVGTYAYNSRIDQKGSAGSAVSVEKKASTPAVVKADPDAKAAVAEGDAADKVDISDADAEDSDTE